MLLFVREAAVSCCVWYIGILALLWNCQSFQPSKMFHFARRWIDSQNAFEMTHEKSLSWWHIFVCKRSRHNDQCFDLDYCLFSHFFTGCGLCKYLARNGIVSPELAQNSRNIDRRAILPTSHPIISESNSDDAFQCIQMHQNASKSTSRGSLHFGGLRDGSRSPLDVALRHFD